MRLLAIDIGNSRIKCALFQGSEIEHTFEMDADRLASGAAYRHSLRAHVRELGPQRAAIASVVPELNERVGEAVKRELMILPEFVTAADVPPGWWHMNHLVRSGPTGSPRQSPVITFTGMAVRAHGPSS